MPRPLIDSEYIFGIHEPGGEQYMLDMGRPGWILFHEVIGHDPDDRTGVDFTTFSSRGLGVMCRIDHGLSPDGVIPHSSNYTQYARRMANFVATSRGCKIWIIGNEMNYVVSRPGVHIDWSRHASVHGNTPEQSDPLRRGLAVRFNILPDHSTEIRTTRGAVVSLGEAITPELYARCYRLCRDAIRNVAGHRDDQVLVGAVAPWNTQTMYPGNPNGDWTQYFRDILELLGPNNCDGFALHAYTHGADPSLISSTAKLPPPFQQYHQEFRIYQDFLAAVPENLRHLPAYITETDQTTPWLDAETGWVQQAYNEIDAWNKQQHADARPEAYQSIRALILFRWPRMDRWHIDGKPAVIDDFVQALQNDYRWHAHPSPAPPTPPPPEAITPPLIQPTAPAAPPYVVEWLDDRLPAILVAGDVISVPITVRNAGSLTWSWGSGNPVRMGYRYYRNRRILALAPGKEVHTDVPDDVEPGQSITVQARIALPDEPGNYTLEIDLVHEGITWFKEHNSPVLTRWLIVQAPPPSSADSPDDGPKLPVPLFADVSATLPRAGAPYARRSMNQVRYFVISHTGGNPWLNLERIAEAHIRHGYPGIAYHFVVDSKGQVCKVSALEDVAQPDQAWSEQGVNICLTGNFAHQSPPLAQLDAAGRLCAWLAQNLGLGPESIVGLGELSNSDSPGDTFYVGPNWKAMLARQVQIHLAALSGSGDMGRAQELDTQLGKLQGEQSQLLLRMQEGQAEREKLRLFNERLQGEVAELQQQVAAQSAIAETGFAMENVVDKLPRAADRYVERRPEDVKFIVINHTGVAPSVPLRQLAEAHLPDWPGVLYDFFVDEQGSIQQTQPLDEVVDTDQEYLANAINIAFAGNFDQQVPSSAQLYSAAKLIVWLMRLFPHVRLERIKGVSEFIEHTSPGEQWLAGQCWKESLLAAVRRAGGWPEPNEAEGQSRMRLADVERQLQTLQRNNQVLQDQRLRLQAENQRLQGEMVERKQDAGVYVVPKPIMRDIVDKLPKHPSLRYERRTLGQITHIAIHHTAAPPSLGPARIADLHVAPDTARGKEAWPGIGYHYFISADGAIDQTNALENASFHVFRHNTYSVGLVFAGSFMNGRIPTSAQLRAGAHLTAWLMQELNIPLARVWGHREFPDNTTVCPGSEWTLGNRWRDLLFERIEQVRSGAGVKNMRHYMLFWQRAYPGPLARQDFVNAINYIVRFRPSLGFSVEEARNAEYVTIVGGEVGISAASEKVLRDSGCKIERIAGRDEEETSRMLAELARLGRRFRSFDVDF